MYFAGGDPSGPAARSRFVRAVWSFPPDVATMSATVDWLLQVAPATGTLLIPVDDLGAALTAKHADTLASRYRFPRVDFGVVQALSDKHFLAEAAAGAGVPAPVHLNPQSEDALRGVPAQLGWPLVVKAKDTELLWTRPGGRSVSIARDDGELTSQWRNHLVEGRPNCIVQEYIPGGPETVWMVNAYYDATSTALFAASGRKVRQYPAYTGATSFGVCERNVEVIEHTERLVRHVGYRGILDIGWRFDARDGRYKVLDANPRIGATFRLFATDGGDDVVRAMQADFAERPAPVAYVRDGRTWLHEPADLRTCWHYIHDGELTLLAYVQSLAHVDEHAWYAADDRGPMPTVLRDLGWDAMARLSPVLRRRTHTKMPIRLAGG